MSTLIVQMGHVARTSGATGTTGEQEFARAAADAIRAEFGRRRGHDWQVRVILADADSATYAGSAFVAIHCDGSVYPTARGASVGYQTVEGMALGQRILTAYEAHGWTGGFRAPNYTSALASYYGVRRAAERGNSAAVILEAGFLTNREGRTPTDRDLLTGADGPARLARAVADAVIGTTSTATPEDDDMPLDSQDRIFLWQKSITDGITAEQALREVFTNARQTQRKLDRVLGALDPAAMSAAVAAGVAAAGGAQVDVDSLARAIVVELGKS